ncbi:hypothetical protein [Pseudoalteromonas byunsanensis]|uniref:Uncharacterized protein n=1 Tax=Pseudoalteromonas byunsanensis TaxID=327939 RepID=A0A1S1N2L2_9GAMM|nr:hypothetical protein [Pseudoalteromonas byunsanensis]OHU93684.1 hypothetical protein BIW53_20325 [Pseudoalteromonas byunsanensis]
MFKKIIYSWQLARAEVLRKEFSELLEAWSELLQTDREESGFIQVSLKICFDEFGSKEQILSQTKKQQKSIVKEVEKWMRKAPLGNAIGYAWFAKWLESSYLPGENAKLVHQRADDILFNIYKMGQIEA